MNFPPDGREKRKQELDEEINSHLNMAARDREERGESAAQAAESARRELGNASLVREVTHDQWAWSWLEQLAQDVKYGCRVMRRSPGFTLVVVMTLALGIGANVAIFSVVRGVLLRPLPYGHPDGLVFLWDRYPNGTSDLAAFSPPDFKDLRLRTTLFEGFAAASGSTSGTTATLLENGQPQKVDLVRTTANFFSLLGVEPLLGRTFTAEDDAINGPHVTLLSYGFWQSKFGGDPNVVGRTLRINDQDYVAVGVLPRTFQLLLPAEAFQVRSADIWMPSQMNYDAFSRDQQFLSVIARLKPGVTAMQGQSELDGISLQMQHEYTLHQVDQARITLSSLQKEVVKGVRTALLTLSVVVAFVLLIACGNVANLMLSRATVREKEIAVRTSLGATKLQIFRGAMVESTLLSLCGGVLGILLAYLGIRFLVQLRPANVPRLDDIRMDGWVLSFCAAACILTAVLLSLVPALQVPDGRLVEVLKEGGRSPVGAGRPKLRRLLVIGEIALSLILLIGAGLFVRGFEALQQMNPGFRTDGVQTFQLAVPNSRYPKPADVSNFYLRLNQKLALVQGVEAIGSITQLPLTGTSPQMNYAWDARSEQAFAASDADWHPTSPDFFSAMGIRLNAGRDFANTDDLAHPRVVIVDSWIAKEAWPGQDPIGKRLKILTIGNSGTFEPAYSEVIGVVDSVHSDDITKAIRGQIYVSVYQEPFRRASYAMRIQGDPTSVQKAVAAEVAILDREMPVFNQRPFQDYVAEAMAPSKFSLVLVGIFSLIALVLASIGLYGVVAYSVSQRRQEIGVRMALGALPGAIFSLVVGQGMAVVGIGIAIGLAGAWALTRFINSMLYGVSTTDPLTFVAISALLSVVAFVACVIPALRAMRLDPMVALRYE